MTTPARAELCCCGKLLGWNAEPPSSESRKPRAELGVALLADIHEPVVQASRDVSDDESEDESVGEANQTTSEADAIADEKLTEKGKIRTDDGSSLEDEKIGGDKQAEPQ